MNKLVLTGQTQDHLKLVQKGLWLMPEVAEAYLDMCSAALKDGLEIFVISAYRSFNDQLSIWNRKFNGILDILDLSEVKVDIKDLNATKKIEKILYWSALPGGSRHHWGTDIDVIDGSAVRQNISYQLVPSESNPDGIFHQLYTWLKKESSRFGFYFPYQGLNANMYLEPWHISYASISKQFLTEIKPEIIREAILNAEISGKTQVLKSLVEIFNNKILNVCSN
jgi:LAS superfamily LD-carboxypeptidase LdcB